MKHKISSGSPFEQQLGYSRAIVDQDWIHVSGTVGMDPNTNEIPEDPAEQTEIAFNIIEDTLKQADASLSDVVRWRLYVTEKAVLPKIIPVLGEKFRDIRPANTTLICDLPVEGAKIEIEVTAKKSPIAH